MGEKIVNAALAAFTEKLEKARQSGNAAEETKKAVWEMLREYGIPDYSKGIDWDEFRAMFDKMFPKTKKE